ncbi:MAG: low specificity L-threonine aldolase [Hyphomicrobiales bacterium]|nr:low specificity L-threonine aldolase [Hyphomicrobiales bacterium]MDE2115520.1 low specificity L-threonine aldolase [Hyphomicrobiales bacterium]
MNFTSDNSAPASPEILDALIAANKGPQAAYGEDDYTRAATAALRAVFETNCEVAFVATGTAANSLALAQVTPSWGGIFCHPQAHINTNECAAPEAFCHGAKIITVPGDFAKMTGDGLTASLARYPRGPIHTVQPAAMSLSQATESGTIYSVDEIATLADMAHAAGMKVHMDGARFANAIAALNVSPAEMTWRAGVDVLCLGATKGGALACEAVIFFDPALARDFGFRRKQSGHVVSKGRWFGAQMTAWLQDELWLRLARHANAQSRLLADGLAGIPGVRIPWPVQTNEVFAILPQKLDAALRAAGASYYFWPTQGLVPAQAPVNGEVFVRMITSFATTEAEIAQFLQVCRAI